MCGHIVSRKGAVLKDIKDFLFTDEVVVFEFVNACSEIGEGGAVSGEDEGNIEVADPVEACEVGAEGVGVVQGGGDVWGDVAEDVIARDEDAFAGFVEAEVSGAVAGCLHDREGVFANVDGFAVSKNGERGEVAGAVADARVLPEGVFKVVFGKSPHPGALEEACQEAFRGYRIDPVCLGFVKEDAGAWRGKVRHETYVIGMVVRNKEVGSREVELAVFESCVERLTARGAVHAGVYDEISVVGCDHVGIDGFQWIPRQGDFNSKEIWK